MRILAFITDPPVVDKILRHVGWHPWEPAPDLIRASPARRSRRAARACLPVDHAIRTSYPQKSWSESTDRNDRDGVVSNVAITGPDYDAQNRRSSASAGIYPLGELQQVRCTFF
jgi:hypothetical protein